ncbi:hypothetical protein G6F64_015647 [Rhizopus arrhizus]|uniref:Uncharacterized protein n=1 Tax=Rhizopus oryzae TaxID=64495 RepID=A0A9P7BID2_RHIOR|nr:hypothetical protein G6F64_015647 [Rhizopus arrhizus]
MRSCVTSLTLSERIRVLGNASSKSNALAKATPDNTQNAARQPTADPSKVPSGTPRDKAMGVPTMASAIAWPCW